jgi:hypothetical protein
MSSMVADEGVGGILGIRHMEIANVERMDFGMSERKGKGKGEGRRMKE